MQGVLRHGSDVTTEVVTHHSAQRSNRLCCAMSLNRGGALWINLGRPTKEKGRGTTPDPPAHGLCTVQVEVCSALLQKQPGFTSL